MYPYAINEVRIQRIGSAMLEVDVKMNGKPVATYLRGDGIIVATPTGSTAYSLSGWPHCFPAVGCACIIAHCSAQFERTPHCISG